MRILLGPENSGNFARDRVCLYLHLPKYGGVKIVYLLNSRISLRELY